MRGKTCLASSLLPLITLSGCGALKMGVLNAAGPVAAEQRHLYIVVSIVLIFVAGPVLLLTPLMAWHYRRSNRNSAYKPRWRFSWPLEGLIWIPPIGIVVGLAFLLWYSTHRLDPYRTIDDAQPPLVVQAVALDWKWLFIYPDDHIAVVNQLAIPAGRSIRLDLTSGTVLQALLIPRLAGQIYAMAGMETHLNLAADKPGIYRGENTQYNGAGFPREKFDVVALSPDDYRRWVQRVRHDGRQFDPAVFQRSVAPKPLFYSDVPGGLFGRILVHSKTAAGLGSR